MNERATRAVEIIGALLVSAGAGLIYFPAGLIVLGALMILAMQAFGTRNVEAE
jgi:hypothetical protein